MVFRSLCCGHTPVQATVRIETKCHEFCCWHLCATAGVSGFGSRLLRLWKPVVKALSGTGMAGAERAGRGGVLVCKRLASV